MTEKAKYANINAALTIAKKQIRIATRYKLQVVFWGVAPVLWVIPIIFTGLAISGGASNEFLKSTVGTGNFIDYVIIGTIIYSYMGSTIWAMGNSLRWEQYSGTLETLYLAPVSRLNILLGSSLSQSVIATLQAMIQFMIFSLFFNIVFPFSKVVVVAFLVLLMVIGLYGFAFFLAAIIIFLKDPDILNDFIDTFFYLVTPINYPLEAIPSVLRIFGLLIPLTYTIIGARAILIGVNSIFTLWQIIVILVGLAAILWASGYLVFKVAEQWTKKKGKLSAY
ncbi:MAG: ABC transporter permease [Candidatus Odinarchaeota archaeon]|nr:ABC transporter permease [Candidatus Odinarchaeota archaeon]